MFFIEYVIQIYIEETEKWVTIETFDSNELDKACHNLEFYMSYPHNKYRLVSIQGEVIEKINTKGG